ncbi:MAG: serine/threonine-protein kinase RsbW [Paraglaciecola sp.]|jgi:serine/threonine-protein kinase RsbW
MKYVADISCKSCTSELQKIRHAVKEACIDFNFDLAKTNRVVLAIDEACANVIRHSCDFSESFKLSIIVTQKNGYGIFLVVDNCSRLSPDALQPCQEDVLKPGGLGLQLIYQVMDSVTLLDHPGQGNRLELKIKL